MIAIFCYRLRKVIFNIILINNSFLLIFGQNKLLLIAASFIVLN